MVELSQAWVTLTASTRDLERDVTRALERASSRATLSPSVNRSQLASEGTRAGRAFEQRFSSETDDLAPDIDTSGIADSGGEAGAGFVSGFGDKLKSLGGKAGPIGLAFAGAAGVALAGGKLIADAVFEGMNQQQGQANVAAKLGVDPATMAKIALAAGKSYSNNFGESVESNLETARVAIQGGLVPDGNDPGLQRVIEQLSTVNDVIGGDLTGTTKAASVLIRNGLAKDATEAFDIIVKGYQKSGDLGDDLIDTLSEYSSGWKNTGLTAQQSLALIQQSVDMGVDNTDRGADALREFGRRVTEEGPKMVDSLNSIGLNGQDMYEQFKKGGPEAFAAFDKAFDTIRGIEDPTKRNAAAMALLGDTAGDFIGTFAQWDPSAAVQKFGSVEGAAQQASDTIGGTSLGAWDTLTRTLETGADGVRQTLATAFGPTVTDFATGITNNGPALIEFFSKLAEAALFGGTSIVKFGADSLRALAQLANGVGDVYGGITKFGARIKELTGDQEGANQWYAEAEAGFSLGDSLYRMADSADAAYDKLVTAGDSIRETGERAADAARLTQDLGTSVTLLPDQKSIVLTAPSDEALAGIDRTRYAIGQIPGTKDFKVVPLTQDATTQVNAWVAQQTGKKVDVPVVPGLGIASTGLDAFRRDQANRPVSIPLTISTPAGTNALLDQARARLNLAPGQAPAPLPNFPNGGNAPRADGAIVAMANGGLKQISKPGDAGLYAGRGAGTIFAEQETGGEAYIPLAAAKRGRSKRILSEVARLFGMNLMADGGITLDSLKQYASQLSGGSYVRGGPPGLDGTDCSGAQAAIANFITGGSGRFGTATEAQSLLARGFQQGDPPPGVAAYWIGWKNGGEGGGHTAGTIVDPNGGSVNVEMGGANGGGAFGGGAQGASGFPNRAWIQVAGGEDPNAPNNFSGSSAAVQSASASVSSAKAGVTSAQASVDQANAAVADAKSKGASADKIAALEAKQDAAEQKLTAAKEKQTAAETKLTEVKEKAAGGADSESGGVDGKSLGQIFGQGVLETLGLPNFMNLLDTPNAKSLTALANYGIGLLGGQGGTDPTGGVLGGAGGALGLPNLPSLVQPNGPQALTPNSGVGGGFGGGNQQHLNGATPGPTFNVTATGMDPKAVVDKQNASFNMAYRKGLSAVRPR